MSKQARYCNRFSAKTANKQAAHCLPKIYIAFVCCTFPLALCGKQLCLFVYIFSSTNLDDVYFLGHVMVNDPFLTY